MKKKEVNVEELNKVITTGSKILKIFYIFLIIALISLGIFLLGYLNILPTIITVLKVMSPFFIGFVLAWLLNPIISKITDKGMKRGFAVAIVYVAVAILIYLFCLIVIPNLITQMNEFAKSIPGYLSKITTWINNFFNKLSKTTSLDMTNVKAQFMNYITNLGNGLGSNLPNQIITIVQNTVSGIGRFLVGYIIGFYLSFNFNNVNKLIMNIVPKRFKADATWLISQISEVLYKFVNGTILLSLLLFVTSVIGFSLIGLNAPILFALFCAVTNIIPYIGPYIGAVPAIAVGFSQSPLIGILVTVFIVVTQTIDGNILNPIVIGKKMDLHPVTIIISLLIFEHFFGIMGMVVATPIVAVLKIIYLFFDEKYDFFGFAKEKSVKKEISKVSTSK